MSEKPSFFAELKRRNVYKVAITYIVGGWALSQGIAQVFPVFDVPNAAVRAIVLLIILGFPIAVVFAWLFELTPEGIKRTEAADAARQQSRGKTWIYIVIIGAALSIGLFFLGRYSAKFAAARPNEAGAASQKSIAVLPFENLSDDKSNAYFAEGIQDEILTRLSKIAALKVISRSSTMKYKSAPDNLHEVGRQLGVANILEGSVQKIANAVHINVQLIRAATDEHLWAESYDRTLNDVFGVEGEVATAIADQLNAKLTGSEQKAISDKPTQDTAAYDAYLRAVSLEHNDYSYSAATQVATDYEEAVRLDPKFALAWARLAETRSFLYFNSIAPTRNTAAAVKEAADRAMALAPDAGESRLAQGAYRYRVLRQFESALSAYREAQKRLPNSAFVFQSIALVERRLGRWKEAETDFNKALELDPRDVQLLSTMGNEFYSYLRRFDEALAMLDRALQITPDSVATRANKANVLLLAGRLPEAAQELARIPADSTDDWVVSTRALQALYARQYNVVIESAERKLNSIPAAQSLDAFIMTELLDAGYCYAWTGRPEQARRVFRQAMRELQPTPEADVRVDANGTPTLLGLALAGLGEKEKALEMARAAVKAYENDAVAKPPAEFTLAQIQAQLGEYDAAIAALPHLLEVPAGLTITDLKLNPFWDPIRNDARFQKICAPK